VGAGAATVPGWLNLDASPSLAVAKLLPGPLLGALGAVLPRRRGEALRAYGRQRRNLRWGDARKRLPFPDGAVDAVYSSHFIEHVRREDAAHFARECHRMLRPGGIVRLVAPDLRRLARQYLLGENGSRLDADGFVAATLLQERGRPGFPRRVLASFLDRADHLWMYDGESLVALLRDAGFASAVTRAFLESALEDVAALDLPERAEESVYVEAAR
jgi:SAM-dependent methyltransferase